MKPTTLLRSLIPLVTGLSAFSAWAGPQAHVVCAYDHTAGDDAIMMYGMPNHAMLHDFFGNTHIDAYTDHVRLRNQPETNCDNKADSSAWWAPTMRLPDGQIVKPAYQKTYYQSTNVDKYPLTPFPPGLELLAGDHHGTGPNRRITFLCGNGKGYTNTAGEVCGLRAKGDAVQFNIGLKFPNCWDGVNLKPVRGRMNATYTNDAGACPAEFPVKIPTVNMNVAWVLPQITSLDTAKIELSMDPVMDGDTRIEKWGSIYTAHADFINGWPVQSAEFMTSKCMNNNMDCGVQIPFSYARASADTWVSSAEPETNFGDDATLQVQDDWRNGGRTANKEIMSLVKFPIPPLPEGYSEADAALFKYTIRIYGGRNADGADQVFFYPTDTRWDEHQVTWNNRPPCNYLSDGIMYTRTQRDYRYVDVDKAVRAARAAGKTEIAWYIGGDRKANNYTFNPAGTKEDLLLMVTAYKTTPEI
ncbi:CBM96 family carbohydrate-binding protein [Siccibacter turicensis]|uniref:CBM96 family carbohydrate-binding protein n=1 Tax=Siccibacter turicensis TaxID=357233 RepID=UPI003F547459